MRLTQIPWHSGSRLCLSGLGDVSALSPSASGMGPGGQRAGSERFGKPRRLSGVAADLRLLFVMLGGKTQGYTTSSEADWQVNTEITAHLFIRIKY